MAVPRHIKKLTEKIDIFAKDDAPQNKAPPPAYHFYDVFSIAIVVLIVLTTIVSFKMIQVGPFTVRLGIFIAVTGVLLSQILTEIYGFAAMRRTLWLLCGSLLGSWMIINLMVTVTERQGLVHEPVFLEIFKRDPIWLAGMLLAVFLGFYIMMVTQVKMKIMMDGKEMWMRILSSAFIGHGVNVGLFYFIVELGRMPVTEIITAVVSSWFIRIGYVVLTLPIVYGAVRKLKKIENIDTFDHHTNLSPFRFSLNPNQG